MPTVNRFSLSGTETKPTAPVTSKPVEKTTEQPFDNTNLGIGINTIKGIFSPSPWLNVAKNIGQSIARSTASFGISAGNLPTKIVNRVAGSKGAQIFPDQELPFDTVIDTNTSPLAKAVFGGQVLKDVQGKGNDIVNGLNSFRANWLGQTEPIDQKYAVPFAVASIAFDLWGLGGGKLPVEAFKGEVPEQFLKYLAKETDVKVIENTLKNVGVKDENIIKNISSQLSSAKNADEVKNIILEADKPRALTGATTIKTEARARPATPEEASMQYYKDVLEPRKVKNESQIIGSDDLKDYFGRDYDATNHPIYSKAAFDLYKRAVQESPNSTVRFTVGGTGSGKSDFLVPDISEQFNGVIYDSTGWNYDGIKQQIDFAKAQGKTPEIYAIIPDLPRSRAYTHLREIEGKHPVSEKAFVQTHVNAIETLKKLIQDGEEVNLLDTRNIHSVEDMKKADYVENPLEFLNSLGYTEDNVRQQIKNISKENAKAFISEGKARAGEISQKDGPNQISKADRVNMAAERAKNGENFGPRVTPVERRISEGKVRVVRQGNRDVYQYKNKKGDWVNAKDDDTALARSIASEQPAKDKYLPEDQQKIDGTKAMLENVRERLAEHPAKPLLKYIDKKEGQFEDFKNSNLATTQKEADRIRAKNKKIQRDAEAAFQDHPELHDKFDDVDTVRAVIEDYKGARQVEKSLVADKKFLEENLKTIAQIIREKPPLKSSNIDTTEGWGRSIEQQADQAVSVLEGEIYPMHVSYPEIIENTMTPVNRKVNFVDTYLTTPSFVMNKIGFGKEAQMLRDGADAYWKELPKNIDKITGWLKRLKTPEAQLDVYRWLDGEAITLPPGEKEVAMEIRRWLVSWAKRLKLPEDNKISHYITHVFNQELIEKEFDEELSKIITDKIPKGTYDPFLLERLGKRGYIQDLGLSLDAYVKRATRKVHMDPALEAISNRAGVQLEFTNLEKSQFKYIQRYINNIQMRPTEIEEGLDNWYKTAFGYGLGQRPVTNILRTFRQATYRGLLGLNPTSALRNLSQGVNTYAVLGEKNTALGYLKLFSQGSMEELAREGILNAGFVQDRAVSSGKKAMETMDKGLFAMFDLAERINRGGAYFGGKTKYLSENPNATQEEAIAYAKKIVAKTQFLYDTIDTPVGMGSGLAKTLFQFQTYTVKQLEFLRKINDGKNFKGSDKLKYAVPYLRYVLAGLTFVYTIGKIFNMDPKELLPWFRFDTPPSLKFPVEIGKAVIDAPNKYGQDRDLQTKAADIGKAGLGLIPGGSQIRKTYQGTQAVIDGESKTKSGNTQFEVGGSILKNIQAILFGKYANQAAENYFNKETTSSSSSIKNKKSPSSGNRFKIN